VKGDFNVQNGTLTAEDGTFDGNVVFDGSATFNGTVNGIDTDKIEEGNSSVEVVDTGTGYITNVVDGTERLRVDTSGIDVTGTVTADGLNFDIADGVEINALESLVIDIDSDNNDVSRVFQIKTNNTTTLLTVQDGGDLKFNSGYGSAATAYGCRAWVNFDGTGTPAIREDGNVSSISDNGTGDYTVNFTTAMPDANYAALATNGSDNSSNSADRNGTVLGEQQTPTTSNVRVASSFVNSDNNRTPVDAEFMFVAIFR